MRGSQMKTEHPLQRDNCICFIQKRLLEVLIFLFHETISSILLETGWSLMYPQPHPLLHFLVRMEPTSRNVFLQVAKNVEVISGKIRAVRRMLKCFPAKSLKPYPSPDWQYGDGRFRAKIWSRLTAFQGVLTLWRIAAPSASRKRTTTLCSSLLASFPTLDEHTLHYAHPHSNKETTVWTCAFSLWMSSTLHMAVSIRNNSVASFYEECVLWRVFCFHLTVP